MLPNRETAEKELALAGEINPGPWTKHSVNVGVAARNIGEKAGLDGEKAYILGLLHDIGRRVGVVNIPRHVYEGYRYTMDKGWEEAAKICMTHSYPLMEKEFDKGTESEEEAFIRDYITRCQCDEYDWLIQLCDSLAADYGFCILEKRFIDVARRTFEIKEYFEDRMGCSIYDVLPDVGRTTLLCPPPWKPPAKG